MHRTVGCIIAGSCDLEFDLIAFHCSFGIVSGPLYIGVRRSLGKGVSPIFVGIPYLGTGGRRYFLYLNAVRLAIISDRLVLSGIRNGHQLIGNLQIIGEGGLIIVAVPWKSYRNSGFASRLAGDIHC